MVLDGFTLSSTMAVGTRQSPSAAHLMKGMFDGLPLAQSFWRGAGLPNAVEPLALAVLYRQKRSNTKLGAAPGEETPRRPAGVAARPRHTTRLMRLDAGGDPRPWYAVREEAR